MDSVAEDSFAAVHFLEFFWTFVKALSIRQLLLKSQLKYIPISLKCWIMDLKTQL